MADENDIDTEMYLREGAPHATVCKVQLKDGRIGVGIFRQSPGATGALEQAAADKAALDDALENVPDDVCTKCGVNPPNHRVGSSQRLCCACYVGEGHPPADWHIECMRVAALRDPDDLQASLGQPARV